MRVTASQLAREGILIQMDGGVWYESTGKAVMLRWGAALLLIPPGDALPRWTLTMPAFEDYPAHTFTHATTDPVILCLARRAWTRNNMLGGGSAWLEIPTPEAALTELRSGRDVLGGEWPVPDAKLMPLEKTLQAAKA